MMWKFFEWVDRRGQGAFSAWRLSLPRRERATLDEKMRAIQQFGIEVCCLKGPLRGHRHLYKIRVQGPRALRPLLCRGPLEPDEEFTLLAPMVEVGDVDTPAGAKNEADRRREEIIHDPSRRMRYEVPAP